MSAGAQRVAHSSSWPSVRYRLWLQTSNLPAPPLVDRGMKPHGLSSLRGRYEPTLAVPGGCDRVQQRAVSRYSRTMSALPPATPREADQQLSLRTVARNPTLMRSHYTTSSRPATNNKMRRPVLVGDVDPPPAPPTLDSVIRVTRYNT